MMTIERLSRCHNASSKSIRILDGRSVVESDRCAKVLLHAGLRHSVGYLRDSQNSTSMRYSNYTQHTIA